MRLCPRENSRPPGLAAAGLPGANLTAVTPQVSPPLRSRGGVAQRFLTLGPLFTWWPGQRFNDSSRFGEVCRMRPRPGGAARRSPTQDEGKGVRMTRKLVHPAATVGAAAAVTVMLTAAAAGSTPRAAQAPPATTPIKHVVVIIGENHSFDNVFATYQPPHRQKIWNLLSEGIVTKSGASGPHFKQAEQLTASNTKTYSLSPKITGSYKALPAPNTTYVS